MSQANRIKAIRNRLGWTQLQMAEFLGLNRSRVSHMENGQEPTGPVAKLLEQLEAKMDDAVVPSTKTEAA